MKLNKLLSEDGEHVSKGSVGIWLSISILLAMTILVLIDKTSVTKYEALAGTWSTILLIFTGYKTVDKGKDKFFQKDKS